MALWNNGEDEERDPSRKIPPVNIVYAVAGVVFVLLLLLGPRPYDAVAMPLSQSLPWACAYGALVIVLFGTAITFAWKRMWGLGIASLVFAGCSGGMMAAFMTVVQSGTW